jgi:glucokinase
MATRAHRPIVGIDLGGTNINVGIVDHTLRVIPGSQVNKKTQAVLGVPVVLDRIAAAVRESLDGAGLTTRGVSSIGIAAAGAVNSASGVVLKGGNLGFTNVPIAAQLKRRLGPRVFVENDVNAAVYGEWVHPRGAIVGARDALGVWIGTGVGGGLVLNGRLYSGGFFTAGEIGHTTLILGAPLGRRSLEQNCSRTAISDRLLALIASGHESMLKSMVEDEKKQLLEKARKDVKEKGKLTWQFEANKILRSRSISDAYRKGDELTLRVVHEAAELLGTAIAGAVTLLSLPHIVLGGGFTEALGEPWVRAVREATRARVFPPECRRVEVVGTKLKDQAGIIGAALLARDSASRRSGTSA